MTATKSIWHRPTQHSPVVSTVLCIVLGHQRFLSPRIAVPYEYDNLGTTYCGYCHGRLR